MNTFMVAWTVCHVIIFFPGNTRHRTTSMPRFPEIDIIYDNDASTAHTIQPLQRKHARSAVLHAEENKTCLRTQSERGVHEYVPDGLDWWPFGELVSG